VSAIHLTTSLTLIGGILLLIAGEIITKLVIAPLLKLRGSVGEIAYYLVLYANYLQNCSAPRDDTFRQAKAKCRELACQLRAARERGEEQGLNPEEVAFYDALAENNSAKELMGDEKLRIIAHELVMGLKSSVTVELDAPRRRARQDAGSGEENPAEIWIPARFARRRCANGPSASGSVVGRMGRGVRT
jgi:hypothetical protein